MNARRRARQTGFLSATRYSIGSNCDQCNTVESRVPFSEIVVIEADPSASAGPFWKLTEPSCKLV